MKTKAETNRLRKRKTKKVQVNKEPETKAPRYVGAAETKQDRQKGPDVRNSSESGIPGFRGSLF